MPHRPALRTVIALLAAALVVGSVVAPGAFADTPAEAFVESPSADDGTGESTVEQTAVEQTTADESSTDESSSDEPSIEINCTAEEARITAADEYEYSITVASVDLSPSGTSSRSSSSGTYAGNETVSIDGDGFTFVFVTNASTEETVAATYENCALAESEITTTEGTPTENTSTEGTTIEPTTTEQATTELTTTEPTTTTGDAGPSIRIDCNESSVQVIAPEEYEYSLTVGSVTIAPGNLDSSSLGTSEAGNASMTFDADLVYVFVEDGSSDEPVVSAVEYCGSVPADEPDANRTAQQTTANTTTTESDPASQ